MTYKVILIVLFALALVAFSVQNMTPVHVQFFQWKSQDVPLAVLIAVTAAAGVFLGWISTIPSHRRKHKALTEKERELEKLREQQIS